MLFFNFFNMNNADEKQNMIIDIDKQIELNKLKLKSLLQCLKTLNEAIQSSDNIDNPNKVTKLLKELKADLDALRTNISELEHLHDLLETNEIDDFNSKFDGIKSNIYNVSINIEKFMTRYTKCLQYPVSLTSSTVEETKDKKAEECLPPQPTADIADSKVLFISEMQNKVVLPYLVSDLEKILHNSSSKYNSLQDIIDKEYTFKLDKYKNASISRFKEAYNLMRKKEKSSIVDSLDLALELSFNNLLNPAVISACKNLDELDIYLDCLRTNELEKFNFFKVVYEFAPILKH